MKKFYLRKIHILFTLVSVIVFSLCFETLAIWGEKDSKKFWLDSDGLLAKNGWKLIDDDNDGVGYYYYFDEEGFILTDDITPDYRIVGTDGRRIDCDGNAVSEEISSIILGDVEDTQVLSADILAQINAEQGDTLKVEKGVFSSGQVLYAKDPTLFDGPTPADNIVIEVNPDGTARTILGPNVVLRERKSRNSQFSDPSISKKMQDHVKAGDKYSKKVNGTTFTKQKWKDVMALKGTGATITFDNPSNNFNKLKGRIATHNFTYTDRTTQCTLYIFSDDDGEELLSTSEFNYNSGVSFECNFPKKTNAIRFELEVTGQYTSRVCYLRNCEFGFDREAYEEELYDDETEREYRLRVGTESDAEYYDGEYEDEDFAGLGEIALEGEDPVSRYNRLNNINMGDEYWANYEYEEGDDTITAEMIASISEAKKRMEERAKARDEISGPNFDPELLKQTEALGPDGSSRIIAGHDEGGGE